MSLPANNITFEYHQELNPEFWIDGKLQPDVKDKLVDIAQAFLDSLELSVDVVDATFTGSLANYNYTKYSDVDLHIVVDFNSINMDKDVLEDYFDSKKTVWNTKHNITIKGYEVEVYVQDVESLELMKAHKATGVYSIKTDEWLVTPVKVDSVEKIDIAGVDKKKKAIINMINFALTDECDHECAKNIKEKILNLRQAGLDSEGEYSPENLAFKELRRTGYIEKLLTGIVAKKDKELSLAQETFKQFTAMKEPQGPDHQRLTAGVGAMGKSSGSVNMIAKSHTDKETPFPQVERLKAKGSGVEILPLPIAQKLAAFYAIDLDKVRTQPRGLSTSGIKIGFNPTTNMYMLTK